MGRLCQLCVCVCVCVIINKTAVNIFVAKYLAYMYDYVLKINLYIASDIITNGLSTKIQT